ARMEPWLKLAALVLVVAALGLPVNDLFRYALLVIATVVVVTGMMRGSCVETPAHGEAPSLAPQDARKRAFGSLLRTRAGREGGGLLSMRAGTRWGLAIAVVALCIVAHILFPAPRIEEGHNVFIVDRPGGALEAGLPREAFGMMAAEFDTTYPLARRCAPQEIGCWRGQGFPTQAFAFSADGMLDHPAYSRRVTGIDFSDPVRLHLGFINELAYNWNSQTSDVA